MIHNIKCDPEYFGALKNGNKTFEVRLNDRNYQVGDFLNIKEFNREKQEYTGFVVLREITYVLKDYPAIDPDYVVLGVKEIQIEREGAEHEQV